MVALVDTASLGQVDIDHVGNQPCNASLSGTVAHGNNRTFGLPKLDFVEQNGSVDDGVRLTVACMNEGSRKIRKSPETWHEHP